MTGPGRAGPECDRAGPGPGLDFLARFQLCSHVLMKLEWFRSRVFRVAPHTVKPRLTLPLGIGTPGNVPDVTVCKGNATALLLKSTFSPSNVAQTKTL